MGNGLMTVELLINKKNGHITHVQEQPCEWGRMEDYNTHVAHFGDDSRWLDDFITLVVDTTIEEANEWVATKEINVTKQWIQPNPDGPGRFIDVAGDVLISTKRIPITKLSLVRDINPPKYDGEKRVPASRKQIENIIEDAETGKTLAQEMVISRG